ncbi:hypothetical protein C8R48DRAFT_592907, partial [Suillus tomentosus]
VNRFIQLADDSDEVPKLHGKSYSDFKLSGHEWSKLELMRDILQFNGVANAIHLGLENIHKWYHKTDDTDMYFVYYIALNPNYKLAYGKDKWDTQYFEDGMAHLENLVSAYLPLCELV